MDVVETTGPPEHRAALADLAGALLWYVLAMVLLATLWPLNFVPRAHGWTSQSSAEDLFLNLLLLLPVGFLWPLAAPRRVLPGSLEGLALGLALSLAIETIQRFLPTRCSTFSDVLTNALGCWAGARAYALLRLRLERGLPAQLSALTPLTKLFFLSLPLVALQALASLHTPGVWHWFPLAGFVSVLTAGFLARRFAAREHGVERAWGWAAWVALAWSAAALPLWLRAPVDALSFIAATFLGTRLAFGIELRRRATERRYEHAAVAHALPWLLLYLGAIGCQSSRALPSSEGAARGLLVLRDVAAFTLLGYALNVLHSRSLAAAWKRACSDGARARERSSVWRAPRYQRRSGFNADRLTSQCWPSWRDDSPD